MPAVWKCGSASTRARAYASIMTDHRARAFEVIRSRTGQPAETAAEATARRAREYNALVNPSAEQIADAAAAIIRAGDIAAGRAEPAFFDAPPQPDRRTLSAAEQRDLAKQITMAARRARGENP